MTAPTPHDHAERAPGRLEQIEQRLAAATPGPWAWRNTREPYLMGLRTRVVMAFRRMGTQGAQPQFRDANGLLVDAGRENINDFPDAALIAHAPADLAALVEVVKAVQETRDWLHRLGFMRVEPSTGDMRRRLDAALSRLEDS